MTRAALCQLLRDEARYPRNHVVGNALIDARRSDAITEEEFQLGATIKSRIPDMRFRNVGLYGDLWRAAKADLPKFADLLDGKISDLQLSTTLI